MQNLFIPKNQNTILISVPFLTGEALIAYTQYFKNLEKAIFFLVLVEHYEGLKYFESYKEKWFTLTYTQIKQTFFISIKKQRKFVKELVDEGFISRKMAGLPAKQYFKILGRISHF